jgi:hypothetical protein
MLRDIELMNAGAETTALANPAVADDLRAIARSFSGDRARAAFAAVHKASDALGRNAGTKLVAEWLAARV